MDKYLLEILKDINTVIIPGLGALTITDADKGEFMFMSYLRHDDGVLSKYIAEKEGMDETEAKNLIAKYVREISTKLDQGESYDMFQFGSFVKAAEGDIEFKGWTPSAENSPENKTDSYTEEEISEAEEVESLKENPEENKDNAQIEPETTSQSEENKLITEDLPVKEMNIAQKEELAKNVEKLAGLKEAKAKPTARKKKGTGFYILMVVVALIGSGALYVAINFQDVKQHIPFLADNDNGAPEASPLEEMKELLRGESESLIMEEEVAETEQDSSPGANNESEQEPEIVVEDTPEIVVEKEDKVKEQKKAYVGNGTSGSYHIIAGAFGSEVNAKRLADNFSGQGYSVTISVVNGLNLVSIKSFGTLEEAQSALPDLKSTAPSAWIYTGNL